MNHEVKLRIIKEFIERQNLSDKQVLSYFHLVRGNPCCARVRPDESAQHLRSIDHLVNMFNNGIHRIHEIDELQKYADMYIKHKTEYDAVCCVAEGCGIKAMSLFEFVDRQVEV